MPYFVQSTWLKPDGSHVEGDLIDRDRLREHRYGNDRPDNAPTFLCPRSWEAKPSLDPAMPDEYMIEWIEDGPPHWLIYYQCKKEQIEYQQLSGNNWLDVCSRLIEVPGSIAVEWFSWNAHAVPSALSKVELTQSEFSRLSGLTESVVSKRIRAGDFPLTKEHARQIWDSKDGRKRRSETDEGVQAALDRNEPKPRRH